VEESLRVFESMLTEDERRRLDGLDSPTSIQEFLDAIPYPSDTRKNRSPLTVLRERTAHCLDGALFAALALRRLGYPPLIVQLWPEPGTDDDHVLAIYWQQGCVGSVAKSNFVGLRARPPVYRGLRELVMSYFNDFYNVAGRMTLRAYTRPLNLAAYDRLGWMWADAGANAIEHRLYGLARTAVISAGQAAGLPPVDELTFRAGLMVANREGLFKPGQSVKAAS
jgi:hypothetical protein